jgi:TolB-like protein
MKNIFLLLLTGLFSLQLFAQGNGKWDIILKLNGEELTGKVTEVGDDEIKFTYSGETVVYKIKRADILKVTYSSGRIEIFNKASEPSRSPDTGSNSSASENKGSFGLEDHHNKVAILPFSYIKDDQKTSDELGVKVQNECFAFLNKHSGVLTILDPRTTNAKLIKAGVTSENVKGYTMEEICNILGVEFVVEGMVVIDRGQQSSSSSGNIKTTDNYNSKNNSSTYKTTGGSTTTSTQYYINNVTIGVYNDKGSTLYSQERKSFLNMQGEYKSALDYLLKRTPLYSK